MECEVECEAKAAAQASRRLHARQRRPDPASRQYQQNLRVPAGEQHEDNALKTTLWCRGTAS